MRTGFSFDSGWKEGTSVNRGFISNFGADLDSMIDLKTALGSSEQTYLNRAHQFDLFCREEYPEETELSKGLVLGWLKPEDNIYSSTIHYRAAFIRSFAEFLQKMGKEAYYPPEGFTQGKSVFLPYIFSDEELTALFKAIDSDTNPKDPFMSVLLSVYFRLTYTCGLRPGEGRCLKRVDVDLNSGEIRILESKHHKSRNIVMSSDMQKVAKRYAAMRDALYPDNEYFFPAKRGGCCTAAFMQKKFVKFFALSKPDTPKELLPAVRVYDLRHRFATAVLNQWLDEKVDLNARLPYLRTYMGHKDLAATAYYIHLLPENLTKSAGIDWESFGSLLPRVELWEK